MKRSATLVPASFLLTTALTLGLSAPAAAGDQDYSTIDDPWYEMGAAQLAERLAEIQNKGRAKNIILFIADGMDITLATVTRIFEGQLRGEDGEENYLSFENFPETALVKTYSANAQISGSAATGSAIMTGIKANYGTIGVPDSVEIGDCRSLTNGYPPSIGEIAAEAGKAVGIITTSSVVDATPSTVFAHAASRAWVVPQNLPANASALGCKDIPLQLIESYVEVALGGGRRFFTPPDVGDPEAEGVSGARSDGRNLIDEWLDSRANSAYVWSGSDFRDLEIAKTDSLLGLFGPLEMDLGYNRLSGQSDEPLLAELTATAIDILAKDPDGFFLMVETEETDNLQHENYAQLAAVGLIDLANAVAAAVERVNLDETLIIVTGDHGHSMTFSSYQVKGNPVFGLARGFDDKGQPMKKPNEDDNGKPFTSVGYRDGSTAPAGERPDLTEEQTMKPDYRIEAHLPRSLESHGGQDVPLYAVGPWAHLFSGVLEQNTIFHIMKYAMDPVAPAAGPEVESSEN